MWRSASTLIMRSFWSNAAGSSSVQRITSLFRNATPEVFRKKVYHVTKCQPLHPNVGIIFVEVTQPTTAVHKAVGMVSVCEDKRAARREQKPELTERIDRLMQYKASI